MLINSSIWVHGIAYICSSFEPKKYIANDFFIGILGDKTMDDKFIFKIVRINIITPFKDYKFSLKSIEVIKNTQNFIQQIR